MDLNGHAAYANNFMMKTTLKYAASMFARSLHLLRGPLFMSSLVLALGCGDVGEDKPPLSEAQKEAMAVEAATKLCMATIQGDVARRPEAIEELLLVTELYPNNAQGHYFLGMCSLASFVEDGNLAGRGRVAPSLERAVQLDPTLKNAVGNLALQRFNEAFFSMNPMAIDEATKALIAVADTDLFYTFVLSFGLLQLSPDTPYPQMAVERFNQHEAQCSTLEYCRNSEAVRHHDCAVYMQQGDAYARVSNQVKADEYYQKALVAQGSDSWAFLDEAKQWAAGTADRIALHGDADPTNDPPFFLSGTRACRGCHQ